MELELELGRVVYCVERQEGSRWKTTREGVLNGSFYSEEEALAAADLTARLWIDYQQVTAK